MKRITPKEIVLALCVAAGVGQAIVYQKNYYKDWGRGSGQIVQRINIPEPEVIRVAALGYENLYADLLTIDAIQSFGGAWKTPDDSTKPIYDFFDTITTLDPHFIDVYELGNLILSDDRSDHGLGLELIRKGIRKNPNDWRLPYLGVYTAIWGLQDPDAAREFVTFLRRVPNAPGHVQRMDEYIERQAGRYGVAYDINVKHYLTYIQQDMKVEQGVSINRFRAILDAWNRVEMAQGAERYWKETGKHPKAMEDLLKEPHYLPGYDAPTMEGLDREVLNAIDMGGDITEYHNSIRDNSYEHIVGLPPDPYQHWYTINNEVRDEIVLNEASKSNILFVGPVEQTLQSQIDTNDESVPVEQRFPYFISTMGNLEPLDRHSLTAQSFIQSYYSENGEYPSMEEAAVLLKEDGFGGHFVYVPRTGDMEYPEFYSTTVRRILDGREPRMGLRGTLEDFPRREIPVAEFQPPYLTTWPTIWDFEEDIEWGLKYGLIPGVPFDEQPNELQQAIREQYGRVDPTNSGYNED